MAKDKKPRKIREIGKIVEILEKVEERGLPADFELPFLNMKQLTILKCWCDVLSEKAIAGIEKERERLKGPFFAR